MSYYTDTSHLKALGSEGTKYTFKGHDAALLERFASPFANNDLNPFGDASQGVVAIRCPEFTSLCPLTGQPDFATIVIEYAPRDWCVESKSLKLYLNSFRNEGEFHEACVQRIARDLIQLLEPKNLKVRGEFTPRGGIPFWPEVTYYEPAPLGSEYLHPTHTPV